MKIIDISMKIDKDIPVYKNRESKKPQLSIVSDFDKHSARESELRRHIPLGFMALCKVFCQH